MERFFSILSPNLVCAHPTSSHPQTTAANQGGLETNTGKNIVCPCLHTWEDWHSQLTNVTVIDGEEVLCPSHLESPVNFATLTPSHGFLCHLSWWICSWIQKLLVCESLENKENKKSYNISTLSPKLHIPERKHLVLSFFVSLELLDYDFLT